MKRAVRWIALAATIAALPAAAIAASGSSEATSITIENNKVVSFEYQGATTPVTNSRVTPNKVVYGDNGVTVTLTKIGNASAYATIHSPQGDASAISPMIRGQSRTLASPM
jgi:hypothetical protein